MEKLIESLSPNERKVLLHIEEKNIVEICRKSNLDKVSVLRALEYLQNKEIIKLIVEKKKIVEAGVNGLYYLKKGLPERRLLHLLSEKRILSLVEAQKESKLNSDEFRASLGALKSKAFIELKNGKLIFNANREEVSKKSLEEMFLESLPLYFDLLSPEQNFALKSLQKRKGIVEINEEKKITIEVLDFGKKLIDSKFSSEDLIEQITPEILKSEKNWKGKRFRRYDVGVPVPHLDGGKRHFVNQSIDHAKKIWLEMGFSEMKGNIIQSSFWNFDSLFTPQDHPVREMQDTFFLDRKIQLPEKKLIEAVKNSHEKGVSGSKGWKYNWDSEEAKRLVLRTHTTCLSAQTLSKLDLKDLPKKFFAVGKCFRNETVDWNHGFEFNQTEGIVVGKDLNFRHLMGYLREFAKKMGYEKIRFRPAYFPYTEPSLEGDVWDEERKEWVELIAAGIFRPEVVVPLLGENVSVLAWGPGLDRMIMKIYEIKDLRELYKNDISQLRKMKSWMRF
jgi:phenylalanyl-tRNA synthetase alpha chain